MVLEVLRIIFGLLLIFVLPGTMLIKAMFPRPGELDEEYNGLYVLTLGMATSVCLTILVGFVLGSLPVRDSGKGWFDAPFITASLVALTLVFFAIGWWRGAFPWLGLIDKRLARFPLPAEAPRGTKRHDELLAEIDELTRDRDRLKREVKDLLRRERAHGKKMAEHYREQRKKVEKELDDVRERLETAKEKQSKLIYEARQKVDARQKSRELRKERREREREKSRTALKARPPPEMEETEPEEESVPASRSDSEEEEETDEVSSTEEE